MLLPLLPVPSQAAEQPWLHASIPGFEIYSDVPPAQTAKLLDQLLLVESNFEQIWPNPQMHRAKPGLIVFCEQSAEYQEFARPGQAHPFRELEGDQIAFNFHAAAPSMIKGSYPPRVEYFGNHLLQMVYSVHQINTLGERVPAWLEQGLGKLIRGMSFRGDATCFGALLTDATLPERRKTHGSVASLVSALRSGRYYSLPQLFAATQVPALHYPTFTTGQNGDYLVGPDNGTFWPTLPYGEFMDEAYEFAQFCLFAEGGKYREAYFRFAFAAANGSSDEASFSHFFGLDHAAMLQKLWAYTAVGNVQTFPLPHPSRLPGSGGLPVRFLPVTPAEIQQMKVSWLEGLRSAEQSTDDSL